MIRYRSFLNDDPPRLAEIWRGCAGRPGLAQPISTTMFDLVVLAKPYFDREGLILALDDERPVGFVHAGFGPNEDESGLSTEMGTTVLLLVVGHPEEQTIAAELLARSEEYLRRRGAKVLYGGGIRPLNPFYVGLYGGSELPGILDSEPQTQALFREHDYREIDRTIVLHRELMGFRPPVDRQQMQIRRNTDVEVLDDPRPRTWWEACIMSPFDRTVFQLRPRGGAAAVASATFWIMEPFAAARGVRTSGLIDVQVEPAERKKGLATYLVAESLRQLSEQGFAQAEVQTMQANTAALRMYRKLGFQQVDSGAVFRKEGALPTPEP
ncbi:MAG TPA: GNAT family N-acetyltransferase [Pirellulales bacterium]